MDDRGGESSDGAVAAAVGGDRAAAERVMVQLRPIVRAMVYTRLAPQPHQEHDADDLIQDCSVAIAAGLGGLRSPTFAALRSFASTIVTRQVADFIRRTVARRERLPDATALDPSAHSIWAGLLADSLSPRAQAANREELLRVVEAMIALKEPYREIITLALIDQLPMMEIAERLGMSRPAASMLLIRALRTLRRNVTGSSRVHGNDGAPKRRRTDPDDAGGD